MDLRPTTRDILDLVHTATGHPVQVTRDPDLPRPAVTRMARGALVSHVITLGALAGDPPDYPICHQCGLILRHFARPRGDRWDFGATGSGLAKVVALLTEKGGVAEQIGLTGPQLAPVAEKLYVGLMTQLRSVPIGLRVDAWIMECYPELRASQKAAAITELQGNAAALDPRVQSVAPPVVSTASLAINAAQAAFWGYVYRMPALSRPYAAGGHLDRGRRLLALLDEFPDDGAHDRDLIDVWAAALGIAKWYTWIPYDDPA